MIDVQEQPAEAISSQEFPPSNEVVRMASPEMVRQPGYYGLPIVKPPRWEWEIALYFFFEGISAGSFVLSGMADFFGGRRYRKLVRQGRILAFLTLLPCPPLLIADLGRPERFHHMLRIVKRTSPMNTGAWALTGYGTFAALLAAREIIPLLRRVPGRPTAALAMPFAFTMLAYPGVLLSATSNPAWAHNPFLGALLGCSSISAATASLSLLAFRGPLPRLEAAATVCEAAALAGYLSTAKRAAEPLVSGKQSRPFWLGAVIGGLVLPAILPRRSGVVASMLTLGGALMLKMAITYAGHSSAMDSDAGRYVTRPNESAPGWAPAAMIPSH
jgi:formate-dependent nitrite reductase membrane component NrfD